LEKLKVIELFAGIGAYSKALDRLNVNYEVVSAIEKDKKTIKSYNVIHNSNYQVTDITTLDERSLPDCDMICYSPPCQAFSNAGKQLGFEDKRGILFFDALRIIKEKKPKYCIMENVKGLTQKKFKNEFKEMLNSLEEAGYVNYKQILNAKNHGIPQNRERIFIISIRKDVIQKFNFPKEFDNGLRLRDLLEPDVDEKYYINQDKTEKLVEQLKEKEFSNTVRSGGRGSLDRHQWDMVCVNTKMQDTQIRDDGLCCTLTSSMYKEPPQVAMQINHGTVKIKEDDICSCIDANYGKGLDNHAARTGIMQVGMLDIKGNEQIRRVYDPDGLSPTLNTMTGGNRQPKILENNELKFVGGIDTTEKWIEDKNNLSRNYKEGYRVYDSEGIACCQKTNGGGLGSNTGLYLENTYRIRKLTPLECLRLMGFDDEDYYILKDSGISNSQIYKMAGNSIVVNVLEEIFKALFSNT